MASPPPVEWHVLRTSTRQEHKAVANLKEIGATPFLPCWTRWRRTSRIKERVRSPLIPGYMFALLEPHHLITIDKGYGAGVTGVSGVFKRFDGQHRTLPAKTIEDLRIRETDGEFDKTRRTRPDPIAGSKVSIIGGQFQGFPAEFVKRRPDDRIELLFQICGRWSPLTLKAVQVSGFAEEDAA